MQDYMIVDTGIYERGYVVYQLLLTTCTGVDGWWFVHFGTGDYFLHLTHQLDT